MPQDFAIQRLWGTWHTLKDYLAEKTESRVATQSTHYEGEMLQTREEQ